MNVWRKKSPNLYIEAFVEFAEGKLPESDDMTEGAIPVASAPTPPARQGVRVPGPRVSDVAPPTDRASWRDSRSAGPANVDVAVSGNESGGAVPVSAPFARGRRANGYGTAGRNVGIFFFTFSFWSTNCTNHVCRRRKNELGSKKLKILVIITCEQFFFYRFIFEYPLPEKLSVKITTKFSLYILAKQDCLTGITANLIYTYPAIRIK